MKEQGFFNLTESPPEEDTWGSWTKPPAGDFSMKGAGHRAKSSNHMKDAGKVFFGRSCKWKTTERATRNHPSVQPGRPRRDSKLKNQETNVLNMLLRWKTKSITVTCPETLRSQVKEEWA